MVDTLVSGASASRHVGSSPISGTIYRKEGDLMVTFLFFLYLWCLNKNYQYEDSFSGCGYNGRCLF